MYEPSKSLEDYKRENKSLIQQLELKQQQVEDLQFEVQKMRKEQNIWQHLEDGCDKRHEERQKTALIEENLKLKSQLITLANENDHRGQVINEQKEKIEDLKYTNQELKKLREKSEQIHKKEVSMLMSGAETSEALNAARAEKEKLEKKIAKCDQIGREMEDFYLQEIETLNSNIEEQKKVIKRLEKEVLELERELIRYNEEERCSQDKMKEMNYEEVLNRQSMEKKFELALYQTRARYERQINELKDHIKFLIVKLESVQDNKAYYDNGLASSLLAQSKLVMSNTSSDSFRFTPNNSFSSSIKESLSRRETGHREAGHRETGHREAGQLKTPNKTQRQSKNLNFALERTNV